MGDYTEAGVMEMHARSAYFTESYGGLEADEEGQEFYVAEGWKRYDETDQIAVKIWSERQHKFVNRLLPFARCGFDFRGNADFPPDREMLSIAMPKDLAEKR